MAMKNTIGIIIGSHSFYLLILSLFGIHLAIAARLIPLFQSYERSSFPNIFDTSKYGILQLNNGLAQTPQMGLVSSSSSFSSFYYSHSHLTTYLFVYGCNSILSASFDTDFLIILDSLQLILLPFFFRFLLFILQFLTHIFDTSHLTPKFRRYVLHMIRAFPCLPTMCKILICFLQIINCVLTLQF